MADFSQGHSKPRSAQLDRRLARTLFGAFWSLIAPAALMGGCSESPCDAVCDCVEDELGADARDTCEDQCEAMEDDADPRSACEASLLYNGVGECLSSCDELSSGHGGASSGTGGFGGSGSAPSSSSSGGSGGSGASGGSGGSGGGASSSSNASSSSSSSSSSSGGGASCETLCSQLYDCGLEDGNCPGFAGTAPEKDVFIDTCVPTCESNPALAAVIDTDDCASTVQIVSGANADFDTFCQNGLSD